jgi:hypothetical protein
LLQPQSHCLLIIDEITSLCTSTDGTR